MWTDNGGENKENKMLPFLEQERLYPHFTFRYNTQHYGTVESFWKKIDKCCKYVQDIPCYIQKFNTIRIHARLVKTHISNDKYFYGSNKRKDNVSYN